MHLDAKFFVYLLYLIPVIVAVSHYWIAPSWKGSPSLVAKAVDSGFILIPIVNWTVILVVFSYVISKSFMVANNKFKRFKAVS